MMLIHIFIVITVIFVEGTQQNDFYDEDNSIDDSYKPIYVDFVLGSDEKSSDDRSDVFMRRQLRQRHKLSYKKRVPVYIISEYSVHNIMDDDSDKDDMKKSKKKKFHKKMSNPVRKRRLKSHCKISCYIICICF
ncbi:uncharacterized protein LOC133319766 [Danaus plexippus]|uniref:uncharacterized protein LOC133319766 n=1 Tax=Danaus plexippus TaxID=13037 RepID=UPI002AAF51BF|nr:uncharacterized protein LOC133319766 [Danaus plexippus]